MCRRHVPYSIQSPRSLKLYLLKDSHSLQSILFLQLPFIASYLQSLLIKYFIKKFISMLILKESFNKNKLLGLNIYRSFSGNNIILLLFSLFYFILSCSKMRFLIRAYLAVLLQLEHLD